MKQRAEFWQVPRDEFLRGCSLLKTLIVELPKKDGMFNSDLGFEHGQLLIKQTKSKFQLEIKDTPLNRDVIKSYKLKIKEIRESEFINFSNWHKQSVLMAIAQNLPVPEEVLKDYPDTKQFVT